MPVLGKFLELVALQDDDRGSSLAADVGRQSSAAVDLVVARSVVESFGEGTEHWRHNSAFGCNPGSISPEQPE